MIGPIDGRGGNFLDRFPRLGALQDLLNQNPVSPPEQTQSQPLGGPGRVGGAAINIASQVSQMLQAVGGGAQNDKLLQLLITLLVLAAMLQDTQSTQNTASSLLSGLGKGQTLHSYQSLSITTTEMTWQTQYTQQSANAVPAPGCDSNLDTQG